MAAPKLQIEQRVERIEMAVSMMLVQLKEGFNEGDAERIERVLRGEEDASEEPSAA